MRYIDSFAEKDYSQVISFGMPPLESLGNAATVEELARLGNDGMAELVQNHPGQFCGFLASLPMNSEDAAPEAERAFSIGANGVQLRTNINGYPLDDDRFFPVFETAARHGKPVFLHPSRGAGDLADYKTETKSKYEIWWTFGWPYETSAAMARLVFSGLLDKLPELKVLAQHLGAMVPFFEGRVGPGWDQLGKRTSDEDYSVILERLQSGHWTISKISMLTPRSSAPALPLNVASRSMASTKSCSRLTALFDPERGPRYIRGTIAILESLNLPEQDMEKICFRNAQSLLGLT